MIITQFRSLKLSTNPKEPLNIPISGYLCPVWKLAGKEDMVSCPPSGHPHSLGHMIVEHPYIPLSPQ